MKIYVRYCACSDSYTDEPGIEIKPVTASLDLAAFAYHVVRYFLVNWRLTMGESSDQAARYLPSANN
jgi:hypothetical protein